MDDKRTPMEAEVQELAPVQAPAEPEHFYGTAAKPKPKRNYTGLLITLSFLMITASTVSILSSVFGIDLEIKDGVFHIQLRAPDQTLVQEETVKRLEIDPDADYRPASSEADHSVQLHLAEGGEALLSPSEIYAQVAPAVVGIQVESYYGDAFYTGVVVSEDGYILSATDGLSAVAAIMVSLSDGRQYWATLVGEEQRSGLCLLKVEAEALPVVSFAQDDGLCVGQTVYCICNPYGSKFSNAFYDGMLAAMGKLELGGRTLTLLQSSAQPDNAGYGCPILDSRGLVVGLTTAIGRRMVSGEDPCLSVSARDLSEMIELFQEDGEGAKLWLGMQVEEVPELYQMLYGFPGRLWIAEVEPDSALAGKLFQYDVITEVDGVAVDGLEEYEQMIAAHAAGELVCLTIYRSGDWYHATLPVVPH